MSVYDPHRNVSDQIYRQLKYFRDCNATLSSRLRTRLSDGVMRELASALTDGTVFEIVRELEDIQQLKERRLHQKRKQVLQAQQQKRNELVAQQKKERAVCPRARLESLARRQQEQRHAMDERLQRELQETDQSIVKEMDVILKEQQTTLCQAAVPFFRILSEVDDTQQSEIEFQIQLLELIQKTMSASIIVS